MAPKLNWIFKLRSDMRRVLRKLIALNSSSRVIFKENFTKAKYDIIIMTLIMSLKYLMA